MPEVHLAPVVLVLSRGHVHLHPDRLVRLLQVEPDHPMPHLNPHQKPEVMVVHEHVRVVDLHTAGVQVLDVGRHVVDPGEVKLPHRGAAGELAAQGVEAGHLAARKVVPAPLRPADPLAPGVHVLKDVELRGARRGDVDVVVKAGHVLHTCQGGVPVHLVAEELGAEHVPPVPVEGELDGGPVHLRLQAVDHVVIEVVVHGVEVQLQRACSLPQLSLPLGCVLAVVIENDDRVLGGPGQTPPAADVGLQSGCAGGHGDQCP
mmetsp:Transcript_23139/g.41700  ORF Transcript_23139/g.41700 Transcript_23139/m.41700 type:complete len:261 (-) Transcript_23139:419-1201(-)